MLDKYGVEYVAQLPENVENMKINNPIFIEENKEKIKQTCLEIYGVEHISQTDECKEKFKGLIIEVKSTWTYKAKQDNIQEKAYATKVAGYKYEIWIYDSKGNKTVAES